MKYNNFHLHKTDCKNSKFFEPAIDHVHATPATPFEAVYWQGPYAFVSVPVAEAARVTFCIAMLKQGCKVEQLIETVWFFLGKVYPVKLTKAIFETSILDVPR